MGIYICAMVLVSAIFLLAETKPPKINEAQFLGNYDDDDYIGVVREVEKIEKTDMPEAKQREDNKTVSPFEFDVNVFTETKRETPPEKVHFTCIALPSNSTAFAIGELKKRKRYFISFCKRCCCRFRQRHHKIIN